jgi:hypothetical protein
LQRFLLRDTNAENFDLENQPDLVGIRVKERPCEALEYAGKIGMA